MQFSGLVVKKPFGKGSKSEHEAVFLETQEGPYVLRRKGGNPFRDLELEKLVGKTIRCTGMVTGYTLLISEWSEVPDK
jgi:hypothetical protein